jgi:DNA-3-methyladenine glycosylase II
VTPPFRLDLTAWVMRRGAHNAVDRWDARDGTYQRVFDTSVGPLDVTAAQRGTESEPALHVHVSGEGASTPTARTEVSHTLERSLGLSVDLSDFYRDVSGAAVPGPMVDRFRGVHPPRFHTLFEALLAAVSCQQLSLVVGISLLNRLSWEFGRRGPCGAPAFPRPADLDHVEAADIRALGYSSRRAAVITSLAREVEEFALEDVVSAEDDAEVRARLCAIQGIGPWSADYVLLRGMGRLDVFPGDDAGARKRLRRLLGPEAASDPEAPTRLVAEWKGWAGLLYFHLLLDALEESGQIGPAASRK